MPRRDGDDGRGGGSPGGIPDGLLVGLLAFLLGMALLVWTSTGLAGVLAHGSWPTGVSFSRTPLALHHLIAHPHDVPGAWPETPRAQLSGYGLLWGLFIGQLMVLFVLVIFVIGTTARWRARRALQRRASAAGEDVPSGTALREARVRRRTGKTANDPTHRPAPAPAPAPAPEDPAAPVYASPSAGGPATATDAAGAPAADAAAPARASAGTPTTPTTSGSPVTAGSPAIAGSPGTTGPTGPAAGPPAANAPGGAPRLTKDEPAAGPSDGLTGPSGGLAGLPLPAPRTPVTPAPGAPSPSHAPSSPTPAYAPGTGFATPADAPVPVVWSASASPTTTPRVFLGLPDARRPVALQAVADAPGPALVITSDPSIWAETKDARAKLGPVLLYDPTHRCDTPARLHWSPSAGCGDRAVAAERARALLAPVRPTAKIDTAVADTAETLLRCFLHAAAVDGRQFRHVHRWAQGTQVQDAVRTLRSHPKAASGTAGELEAALTSYPERRDIAQELTARALSALSSVHIRDACLPNRTDTATLDSFLAEGGTLYLVGESVEDPKSRPGAMPLLTALAASVVEHGRRVAERSPSGRLDPPFTLVLEDVAAVAPFPQLPALLTSGVDRGMPTLALLRSREQARTRWPHADLPL